MIRRYNYILENTYSPIQAHFGLTFYMSAERRMRMMSEGLGKTYKSITSASNNGLSAKYIIPVINGSLQDAHFSTLAYDTTNSTDRLREESFKNTMKQWAIIA